MSQTYGINSPKDYDSLANQGQVVKDHIMKEK